MKPRLVFLARSMELGGAETQLLALAGRLQQDFEVTVVTFYPGGALEAPLRQTGVPVHAIGKSGRWDLVQFGARLRSTLQALAPEILHSYLAPPNLMAALLRPRRTRLVWGIRASDMDLRRYDWTWSATFFAERALSWLPDRIVANSNAGREHLAKAGFRTNRLVVIPNGIDTERFRFDPASGATLRTEWLGGAAGPLIGVVARLDPMKDHVTFLRAAADLTTTHPDARFLCVGAGAEPYAAGLRETAGTLGLTGRVIWSGQRRDIPATLSACDVVTLSSAFGEGFPNAIGEAMACERPCAVTDVGDAALVVGECGMIAPRRDPGALAAAWRAVLAHSPEQRAALGAAARRRVVDNFSVDAMVARTAALYRELLAA